MLSVVLSGVSLAADSALATTKTYLFLSGVPGDSTDAGHPNQIEVVNYTHVVGAKDGEKLIVYKLLDRSTPQLATLAATSRVIDSGRLEIVRTDQPVAVFRADLTHITVGRTELVKSSDGSLMEKISLFPKHVVVAFTPKTAAHARRLSGASAAHRTEGKPAARARDQN